MKIIGILIKETGEIIYSRSHHDMRMDSSGKYGIDGGQNGDYCRITGAPDGYMKIMFDLAITQNDLTHDYSNRTNKYGLIKPMDECKYVVLKS